MLVINRSSQNISKADLIHVLGFNPSLSERCHLIIFMHVNIYKPYECRVICCWDKFTFFQLVYTLIVLGK